MAKELNVLHDAYTAVAHLCEQRQMQRMTNSGDPQDALYAEVNDAQLLTSLQMALDAGRKTVPDKTASQLQAFLQECDLIG